MKDLTSTAATNRTILNQRLALANVGQVRPIRDIARDIQASWSQIGKGVFYGAKPYLEAMHSLADMSSTYGCDSAHEIIMYFLCNATTYRGEDAKRRKAEWKKIAGIK